MTYEECLYMKFFAVDVLARAGWVINLDKGQMPSQAAVYLGFVLDTKNMVFRLPEEKVAKILDQVGVLITRRKSQHHVREVASVVGKLQAGVRALG